MRITISTKLIASFLVIVLLMIPFTLYAERYSSESLKESIGKESILQAEAILDTIDYTVYNKVHELELLSLEKDLHRTLTVSNGEFDSMPDPIGVINSTNAAWISQNETTSPFMEELLGNDLSQYLMEKYIRHYEKEHGYSIYGKLYVTNKYGATIALTSRTKEYNQGNETCWQMARAEGNHVDDIEYLDVVGLYLLSMSVRVSDENNSFLGVITGRLDIQKIPGEAQITTRKDPDTEVMIVTPTGNLIYSSTTYSLYEDISDKSYFKRISNESGYYEDTIGGQDKLVSYAHSRGHANFDGIGWILIVEKDKDTVLEPARALRDDLITASFLFIIVSLVVAILLARSFAKPIKGFKNVADEIANGNMEQRVDIVSSDEIGDLALSFNIMAGNLEESHSTLESRVERRTASLEKANQEILLEKNFTEDMINSLPGVFYLITSAGTFGRWNRVFEKVSGYTHEEFEKLTPLDLFQGDDKKLIEERIGEVFEKGESIAEASIVTKDGSSTPYYFTGYRIDFGDLPYCIGVGIDITNLKESEERNLQLIHSTEERVKELRCLFGMVDSIRQRDHLVDILQDIADLIPTGIQYSDIARARVRYMQMNYVSEPFEDTRWKLSSDIIVNQILMGSIDVFYMEERPEADDGPFLTEERDILETITKTLGETIAGRQAMEESTLVMAERAAIVDNMADALLIAGNDLTIKDANPAWTTLTGIERDGIIGKSISELFPSLLNDEEKPFINTILGGLRKGKEPDPFTMTITDKQGDGVTVAAATSIVRDKNGDPLYNITNFKDITDMRRTELQLAVFRRLIEKSGQGMGMANFDTTINYVNPTLLKLIGISNIEEAKQRKFIDFYPPDIQKRLAEEIIPTVMREGQWTGESKLRHQDGTIIPTFENLFLINDEIGNPQYIGDVIADISDLKEVEVQLVKTMNELKRSNSELEKFAYVASHDLQEPLRKVKNFSELLAKRYEGTLDDKADRYLNHITGGAGRMQDLIQDLLVYSRVSTRARTFDMIDMDQIVTDSLENLHWSINSIGVKIHRDQLPRLRVDRSQMTQVFQNLIGNAIKFKGERTPEIHISAEEGKDEWTFAVADNGIGIDMQFAEKIFVVFQRLHSRDEYDGTGIGLAVCKKIVERHGGRIRVESEPGKGTVFSFTILKEIPDGK